MTVPHFIQIHTIHSYSAVQLNRDESGASKQMPFGGVIRTRISSQCLKRRWRFADGPHAIRGIQNAETAVRSRHVIERAVIAPLKQASEPSDTLDALTKAFNIGVYGAEGDNERKRQPLLLGLPEVRYLAEKAAAIYAEHPDDPKAAVAAADELFNARAGERANFAAFRDQASLPGGLESAMFGRMVTSDPSANIESAISVGHSFTVHKKEAESDMFSVVDDLLTGADHRSAAHIGDSEINAGVFYGYAVIDVPALISNLEGCELADWQTVDRTLAAELIERLINIIATVTPGARRGSTAPYTRADFVLAEIADWQPRPLANAFREPVDPTPPAAINALNDWISLLDAAYEEDYARKYMSVEQCQFPNATPASLPGLARWAADAVRNGAA